jgi:mono/diheme cytochrome c family protein
VLKRNLLWTLLIVMVLAVGGFIAFLTVIPPFTVASPDTLVKAQIDLIPPLVGIADPATRALAERGRSIVLTSDCARCHVPPGPENQVPGMYLAGGMRFQTQTHGTVVSRNLTPDKETGLGRRTDADIVRALRSGVRSGVRSGNWTMSHTAMPWPGTASWSDEDIHAVLTYLRHLPPVRHAIPDPAPGRPDHADVTEASYGGRDAGKK